MTIASGPNVATLVVDGGPAGAINAPFVSITFCEPGTSNCTTVDHILVDTGSTGLRVMASLLTGINLPDAQNGAGAPMFECVQFVDGYSWGPLKTADVKIAGEQANALVVQVIDDAATPAQAAPGDCTNGKPSDNSVQSFGANGVLGVAVFREDCGGSCATNVVPATYYLCSSGSCQGTTATLVQQVQNAVYHFATDNNGVIIQLPAIGSAGAFGARGALIFGIDTQTNNQLRSATIMTVDPASGWITTSYNGQTLSRSFIDSGSNALFFNDSTLVQCTSSFASGFYCPASARTLSATNISHTGVNSTVTFNVANTEALLNNQPNYFAFGNLAGTIPLASSFDWGLPFFYGRSVYVAIEGQTTSGGTGPFMAY
ncbi:MAG: DUF3443 domain-containing protein [Steroidobacteraceae bacterium]